MSNPNDFKSKLESWDNRGSVSKRTGLGEKNLLWSVEWVYLDQRKGCLYIIS